MGWFGSDKKENDSKDLVLPELPELPPMRESYEQEEIHQLPALPSSQFGEKFSQHRIKEAITREKEEDDEELEIPELPKVRPLLKTSERILAPEKLSEFTKEYQPERKYSSEKENYIERGKSSGVRPRKQDPVFVRIDKYQESLEVFEKTRIKILEVEELLKKNKLVKEEEEKQIEEWEKQIQEIKDHVQQIDKEMFSKIE